MAHINMTQQRALLLATDTQNSVLTEIAGSTNRMAYSAYGHQSAQQQVMTRLGFNGELCEFHTRWYFLGNGYRAYSPSLKRFHSPDSLSPFGQGGLNPYNYCGGNPVTNKDPSGHIFVPTFTTLHKNITALVGRYQGHRAVGKNPVTALISTMSNNGGLPNTLGAPNSSALQVGKQLDTGIFLPTAKNGGLNHKVVGGSSTPAGDASNFGGNYSGNNHWRQQEVPVSSSSSYTMGRYESTRAWELDNAKNKVTIWTKSPERVRREFTSQADKDRVRDIRDRKAFL